MPSKNLGYRARTLGLVGWSAAALVACSASALAADTPATSEVTVTPIAPAGSLTPVAPAAPVAPVYFSASQIDSIALLQPPPDKGNDADKRDLQAVLAMQKAARIDGTLERAVGDAALSCRRVADALRPRGAEAGGVPGAALPATLASGDGAAALDFATRAALQAAGAVGPPKLYWHRPRPYMQSQDVERRADVAPDYPMAPELAKQRDVSAYPSGHTAFGTACAIVLAKMVPEQRAALFARARSYADARLVVGAHFPTDLEAGRIIGSAAAAVMLQNHQFQEDLRQATAGLRAALGLPAAGP